MGRRPDYFDRYQTITLDRDGDGILTVRLHTDGGPVRYNRDNLREWAHAFGDIGADRDNRVIVITGTGDEFIAQHGHFGAPLQTPADLDVPRWDQVRQVSRLLEIEAPVISAVNGPALLHAEVALLADINLAAETAEFADIGHCPVGQPPADGVHIMWLELLGINRGRYFLLTGQRIPAREALALGVVNEVLPAEELMPRAYEIAGQLATYSDLSLRFMRVCLTNRWKQLFNEGGGGIHYGMTLIQLSNLDRGWITYDNSHDGHPGFAAFRPLQPGSPTHTAPGGC